MKFFKRLFKYKWVILFLFSFITSVGCNKEKSLSKEIAKVESFMNDNLKKVVLDNGLTILVFKNVQTPKVLLQIAYDVGSYVEQEGERGMAHLIEHMIFKGTNKLSEGDIDSISRKYGATFNAFTSKDMTSYFFEVDKNNWQPFMGILADCMQNARFDEQHLASEFKAVIQELKMYKDKHWNVMLEYASRILFPSNHPYHYPVIGFKQDLVNIKAQDLKRFYKKYYKPERATLFIVGDIDTEQVIEYATKMFKDIPDGKSDNIKLDNSSMFELIPDTFTNQTKIYEDIQKNQLGFYWLIPGLKSKNEELVSIVEFVLGQGEGSRLHQRLVEKEKVAASVGSMAYQLMGAGMFLILVEPLQGKTEECKKFIIEELNDVIQNGIKEKELEKVVRSTERQFYQRFQSLSNFTYEWIKSFIATKNELDVFDKVKRLEAISVPAIQKFVLKFLDPFFMNEIEVLPLPASKKDIWLKRKQESDKLDKAILESHPRTAALESPEFVNTLPAPNKLTFDFPKPTKDFTLDNGLNVLLFENKNWPIYSVICRFKQAEELVESKEGVLLDFMMNYLMEGTSKYSKEDNVNFFENRGAIYSFDATAAAVSGLIKNQGEVLERFVDVLTHPNFPTTELEKLKEIFIDLFKRRKDSQADVGFRNLKNLIYKNHPYEWTFDQAIELLGSVDINKLKELHEKYVTPKNMILSISGDFDSNKIKILIKKLFGSWSGEKFVLDIPIKSYFEPNKNKNILMLRDQALFITGRPSPLNVYNKDLIPVKILNFIAFNSLGSRIYQLREQTGLFYTAFGSFAAGAGKINGFDYFGSILNLENIEKTKQLMMDVIDNIGLHGVYKYELDASRQGYLKGIIDLTASNEIMVSIFSRLKALNLPFDYYDKVLNEVQSISLEDINKIAAKYFNSKSMDTIIVGRV